MRTTVTIKDELMQNAANYSGVEDRSKLINHALEFYVRRMAGKRLAALGGTMPDLEVPDNRDDARYEDLTPSKKAARALANLGGTMPDLELAERERLAPDPKQARVAEEEGNYPNKPNNPEDE